MVVEKDLVPSFRFTDFQLISLSSPLPSISDVLWNPALLLLILPEEKTQIFLLGEEVSIRCPLHLGSPAPLNSLTFQAFME